MQPITLDSAKKLIKMGGRIVHIRKWEEPYYLCTMPYDPEMQPTFRLIPSWLWIKDQYAFKIHYLDMSILEVLAFKNNYNVQYDDGVLESFTELKKEYLERREWKKQPYVQMDDVKRKFRDYQIVGSQFMYRAKRVLNADAMGLGKSNQTIGAILLNRSNGNPYKTLIICPSSVKGSWYNEIELVTDKLKAKVLNSNYEKRYEEYLSLTNEDVLIMSYDSFIRDYLELSQYFKPDILVLDECHRIANKKNKITQSLIGGKNIKKTFIQMVDSHSIYLLTGTPIMNKLEDLYALMKLMDMGLFSWNGFTQRYTIMEQADRWLHSGGVKRKISYSTIVGYRNEKELKAKLSLHMIRRAKDQVLKELPEKVFETIDIELDKEERKLYDTLKNDFTAFIKDKPITVANTLSWMTRSQQICNSLESLPDSSSKKSSKMKELKEIVLAESVNRKIVIFSKFKTMTDIIVRELASCNPIYLHGGIPSDERTELIRKFQEDPKYRIFVATIKAGGVGITLTAADMVILYDRWYSPGVNFQAIDRCHRIGQKNTVLVITLRVKNSIEDRIEKIWAKKQMLVNEMVGDELSIAKLSREEVEDLI